MIPKRYIVPVFVPHLGCPNQCVFCNQKKISGKLKAITAQEVKNAIALLKAPAEAKRELAFYGGSFTAIPAKERRSLLLAASEFVASGGVIRLSTRPDAINEEILEELKHYSVQTIELGCQSMDDNVLSLSGRGHSSQDIINAAALIKQYGFTLILQMMTGLPGDTLDISRKTAEKLISLHPDGVRIYPTVIIKDTQLYEMYLSGNYREHTVEEAVLWCTELVPLFQSAGIPIIRLGLNPSDELTGGEAVAGAYHPAFGEMVYGEIYKRNAEVILSRRNIKGSVTILVPKGKASLMAGIRRKNTLYLEEKYGITIKIREDSVLSENSIRII